MDNRSETKSDKRIDNAKPSRVAHVPSVFQIESCECGAASLAMILKYYHCPVPMEQLRMECAVSRDGSNAACIARAAMQHGLEVKGYRKNAEALAYLPMPCIIHWNFNHFVVLEGIKGDKVYLNDPESGRRKITAKELKKSFTGVVLCFAPGKDFETNHHANSATRLAFSRLIMDVPSTIFMVIIGLILVLPGIILPAMTQLYIDHVLLRKTDFWLYRILIIIALIYIYQIVLTWIKQSIMARLKLKMSMITNYKLISHMLRLPIDFFEQRYTGELSTRIENNNQVNSFLTGSFSDILLDIFESVFYLIMMIIYSPILAAIGVIGIVSNVIMSFIIIEPLASMNMKLNQDTGHLNAKACAGFSIISSIKASGIENEYASEMIGSYANTTDSDQKLGMASQILASLPELLSNMANVAVLVVGGMLIIKGDCTTGTLTAFTMILGSLTAPVKKLISMAESVQDMRAGLARVDDIESAREDIRYAKDKDYGANLILSGQVEISNLTYGYNVGLAPVVQNLSMRLTPGSRIAIVGESGCGKSTAAKLIAGMMSPWSGSIKYDGIDITQYTKESLSSYIAVVEQQPMIFTGSIKDNLTFFSENHDEEKLKQAIRDADAEAMISSIDYGIEHQLTEGGRNISGGQRQRLAIARALYKDPSILIMDEATSALDALSEKRVMENIKRRGCTCIIVAHRLSAIRDCDLIFVMDKGVLAECGTHEKLLQMKGIYSRLVEV